MKVADLRLELSAIAERVLDTDREQLLALTAALAPHDEFPLTALTTKLGAVKLRAPAAKKATAKKAPAPRLTQVQRDEAIARYRTELKSAYYNDEKFAEVAAAAKDDKAINAAGALALFEGVIGAATFPVEKISKPKVMIQLRNQRNALVLRESRIGRRLSDEQP